MITVLEKRSKRFKSHILHTYFVRCYMSFILTVVVAAGILSSKLMLELGIHSLQLRYPIALLISFGCFLLLIRIWIWYVFLRRPVAVDLSGLDPGGFEIPGGGGGSSSVSFGGGDSGGAGASSSWEGGVEAPSKGGGGSGLDLDVDLDLGDDWFVILLIGLLVLAIVCTGGYLIYAAPQILPEAAWQAALATGLARVPKPTVREHWLRCVLRKSLIPFAVILILVVTLATVAHNHCPSAVKLSQALHCPVEPAE